MGHFLYVSPSFREFKIVSGSCQFLSFSPWPYSPSPPSPFSSSPLESPANKDRNDHIISHDYQYTTVGTFLSPPFPPQMSLFTGGSNGNWWGGDMWGGNSGNSGTQPDRQNGTVEEKVGCQVEKRKWKKMHAVTFNLHVFQNLLNVMSGDWWWFGDVRTYNMWHYSFLPRHRCLWEFKCCCCSCSGNT